jgi:hypothetical protein
MAAAAPTVGVVGLNALKRDLVRAAGDRGPINAAFAKAGTAAAEPVAAVTRGALPRVSGRLAGDVRVNATRSGGTIRMGRASIRYAGWVEFGGRRRAPHESSRDYTPLGRYLFPHARNLAPTSVQLYTKALQQALDGLTWTNTTTDGSAVHD